MWPQLHLVHGKPRHPQSQGSVERANSDIKDMLAAWLTDNNTQDCMVFRTSLHTEPEEQCLSCWHQVLTILDNAWM